jgi:polyhydroxyalkanoate synthesis regulator phasin
MLITEWDTEEYIKVRVQEAVERTTAKYQSQLSAQQAEIAALKQQLAQQNGGGKYNAAH